MSQARDFADSFSAVSTGRRNLIINGAMQVAQRGTSSTSNTSGGYKTVDRMNTVIASQGTWTVSQSTDAPTGFENSFKMDCTVADASPASTDQVAVEHRIEAQNLTHLNSGSSDAVSTTLSFWVKSNKTGTYTLEAQGNDANRFISKTYTISSADTWEHKVITIDADTGGSGVSNDNGIGWILKWWLGVGSQWNSGTLQTTWATPVTANRVSSSQVNLADSTSNEWYITGVQLEVGNSASPFEHRSYGEELALCQRYYYKWGYLDSVSGQGTIPIQGYFTSGGGGDLHFNHPVEMRARPSISTNGTWNTSNVSSFTGRFHSRQGFSVRYNVTADGNAYIYADSVDDYFEISAEL